MKQALEHILALVGRIGLRSSSLEVQSTLQSIAQTAHQALGKATVLTGAPIPQEEPRMFQAIEPSTNGVSNVPATDGYRAISIPLTGKEIGTST